MILTIPIAIFFLWSIFFLFISCIITYIYMEQYNKTNFRRNFKIVLETHPMGRILSIISACFVLLFVEYFKI